MKKVLLVSLLMMFAVSWGANYKTLKGGKTILAKVDSTDANNWTSSSTTWGIGDPEGYKGLVGYVIVDGAGARPAHAGAGVVDTCNVILTTFSVGRGEQQIDSARKVTLPCTLKVAITQSTAGRDTLFKDELWLRVKTSDSLDAIVACRAGTNIIYNVIWDLILK